MNLAPLRKSAELASTQAQTAALVHNQQALASAQAAHRQALQALASRTPFGRDMLRHLASGKTIEQAFGLAATHYAKIHSRSGIRSVLANISEFAKSFGLKFPQQKLMTLRKNVEFIVDREQNAGRQLN